MGVGIRTPVKPQPAAAPRFGLIASIPPTTDQARWELGIAYSPEGCNHGTSQGGLCGPPSAADYPDRQGIVEWDPFLVQVSDQCSTFSRGLDEEEQSRIERLLNADTERQLGAELWDGVIADADATSPNTWLSDSSNGIFQDLTGAAPAGYVESVSCLEQYLADNNHGQQGAIHATAQVVTAWESFRLVRRENNRVLTFQDTLVIASPGYSGNGPAYSEGIWAYATDLPRIFLGKTKAYATKNVIDRANNINEAKGERVALAEWQKCRHAGIELDVETCGAAS